MEREADSPGGRGGAVVGRRGGPEAGPAVPTVAYGRRCPRYWPALGTKASVLPVRLPVRQPVMGRARRTAEGGDR